MQNEYKKLGLTCSDNDLEIAAKREWMGFSEDMKKSYEDQAKDKYPTDK